MPLSRAPALQSSGRFERARHALGIGPGLGGSAVTELQTFALCVLLLPRPCIVPPSAIASPLPARRSVVATRCRRERNPSTPHTRIHAYKQTRAVAGCSVADPHSRERERAQQDGAAAAAQADPEHRPHPRPVDRRIAAAVPRARRGAHVPVHHAILVRYALLAWGHADSTDGLASVYLRCLQDKPRAISLLDVFKDHELLTTVCACVSVCLQAPADVIVSCSTTSHRSPST